MQLRKLLAVAGLAFAGVASANVMIPSFDFETRTGFENWACSTAVNCHLTGNENITGYMGANLAEHLSWGTGSSQNPFVSGGGNAHHAYNAQSHLDITNFIGAGNSITTNGAWETINVFTHTNNIITTAGGNLGSVDVNGWFQLIAPVGLSVPGVNPLYFDETLNLDSGECPGPNPLGTACDDLFTTTGLDATFMFYSDGFYSYWISFQFAAGPGAAVIPNGDGTFSIYTTEACSTDGQAGCGPGEPYSAGVSSVYTQARIWTMFIPEPSTMLLMGLGVLALGMRRRKM